jgi:hypothetical protein
VACRQLVRRDAPIFSLVLPKSRDWRHDCSGAKPLFMDCNRGGCPDLGGTSIRSLTRSSRSNFQSRSFLLGGRRGLARDQFMAPLSWDNCVVLRALDTASINASIRLFEAVECRDGRTHPAAFHRPGEPNPFPAVTSCATPTGRRWRTSTPATTRTRRGRRRCSAPPRSPTFYALVFPGAITHHKLGRCTQHQLIRSSVENVTARARTIGGVRHWSGALAFGVFDGVGAAHPPLY